MCVCTCLRKGYGKRRGITSHRRKFRPGVVAHSCNLKLLDSWRSGGLQFEDCPGKKLKKKSQETSWAWWFMSLIPATWEAWVGGSWSKASPSKNMKIYLKKITEAERAGGEAQVLEHLSIKSEAWSSNPLPHRPKKKKKKRKFMSFNEGTWILPLRRLFMFYFIFQKRPVRSM
jgi:hypothetical protein